MQYAFADSFESRRENMLEGRFQRGFSPERLETTTDPRIRRDDKGYFVMSLSENSKVYFEDFYRFLELTYAAALTEKDTVRRRLIETRISHSETVAFYRAKAVILDLLLKNIRRFYTDGANH